MNRLRHLFTFHLSSPTGGLKGASSFIILSSFLILAACSGGHQYRTMLDRADSLITAHPDSAYAIITSIDSVSIHKQRKAVRMRYELLRAEAQNKLYIPFTTDSVLRRVVSYYDRHGSHNQQLKARYLLGCAYRDLHEAPLAMACYHNAIEAVDTTSMLCDYHTLSLVYSQMANIMKSQLQLTSEIQCLHNASKYALMARDTLASITFQDLIGSAYILLNEKDSAESILESVIKQYDAKGFHQKALMASTHLIHLYVHQPVNLSKAKFLMDRFEAESDLFDEHHELQPSRRQYFRYKGLYYEQTGRLDSAEYFYRKTFRPNMSYTSKDPMYHGLLSVYSKLHNADSIAKYSQLYCEANDSSIAVKDRELTANIAAQYSYTRYQQKAQDQEKRATHRLIWLIATSAIIFVLVIAAFCLWYYFRRRHHLQQRELEFLREEYESTKDNYLNRIVTLQQTELLYKNYIQSLEERTSDVLKIKAQYENSIRFQQEEINKLAGKIRDFKQNKDMKADLEVATRFASIDIVKKIRFQESKSKFEIEENEWEALSEAVGRCYPRLLQDLHDTSSLHIRDIRACLLVIIGLRAGSIAHFLNIKENVLSKIKSRLNSSLFCDTSAKTLYSNLERRYGVFL